MEQNRLGLRQADFVLREKFLEILLKKFAK